MLILAILRSIYSYPFLHRTLIFDGKIPCCLTIFRNFCSITLNGYVLLSKASKDKDAVNDSSKCESTPQKAELSVCLGYDKDIGMFYIKCLVICHIILPLN